MALRDISTNVDLTHSPRRRLEKWRKFIQIEFAQSKNNQNNNNDKMTVGR